MADDPPTTTTTPVRLESFFSPLAGYKHDRTLNIFPGFIHGIPIYSTLDHPLEINAIVYMRGGRDVVTLHRGDPDWSKYVGNLMVRYINPRKLKIFFKSNSSPPETQDVAEINLEPAPPDSPSPKAILSIKSGYADDSETEKLIEIDSTFITNRKRCVEVLKLCALCAQIPYVFGFRESEWVHPDDKITKPEFLVSKIDHRESRSVREGAYIEYRHPPAEEDISYFVTRFGGTVCGKKMVHDDPTMVCLFKTNYFISPVTDYERGYRYHINIKQIGAAKLMMYPEYEIQEVDPMLNIKYMEDWQTVSDANKTAMTDNPAPSSKSPMSSKTRFLILYQKIKLLVTDKEARANAIRWGKWGNLIRSMLAGVMNANSFGETTQVSDIAFGSITKSPKFKMSPGRLKKIQEPFNEVIQKQTKDGEKIKPSDIYGIIIGQNPRLICQLWRDIQKSLGINNVLILAWCRDLLTDDQTYIFDPDYTPYERIVMHVDAVGLSQGPTKPEYYANIPLPLRNDPAALFSEGHGATVIFQLDRAKRCWNVIILDASLIFLPPGALPTLPSNFSPDKQAFWSMMSGEAWVSGSDENQTARKYLRAKAPKNFQCLMKGLRWDVFDTKIKDMDPIPVNINLVDYTHLPFYPFMDGGLCAVHATFWTYYYGIYDPLLHKGEVHNIGVDEPIAVLDPIDDYVTLLIAFFLDLSDTPYRWKYRGRTVYRTCAEDRHVETQRAIREWRNIKPEPDSEEEDVEPPPPKRPAVTQEPEKTDSKDGNAGDDDFEDGNTGNDGGGDDDDFDLENLQMPFG